MNLFFIITILPIISGQSPTNYSDTGDEFLTTPQIINRHGYASETHTVQTDDGYLLTVHRIPASKNGTKGVQPIFLQHGILTSSADWVDVGDNALGFVLSDQGYDVWLGNARGNTYSKAHVSLPTDSANFWNFSWHEMGIYDVPAAIKHIAYVTGKGGDILYVGHSMGTTMFYVFASLQPEISKNVKAMVSLAPVAFMAHVRSPIGYFAPWANDIQFIAQNLGVNEFLPSNAVLQLLSYNCKFTLPATICDNIFSIFGYDQDQMNTTLLPTILRHVPAGASMKTLLHYMQEIAGNGVFKQFDYGKKGNMIQYGQLTPPLYDYKKIKVPTYLMYADNDLFASPIDVKRLAAQLKDNIGLYRVPFAKFSHLDFLWAKDAKQLLYEPLINFISNYSI